MEGTDWKGYESGEIQYILENGGYTLDLSNSSIAYCATDWVIPYQIKDSEDNIFNVKKIIGSSEDRSRLVLTGSLTIPNSVISIGNYAFNLCSGLTGSLTIPDSVVSIGNNAFNLCNRLTGSLTIGSHVTSIGNSAFAGCNKLTGSLTIPDSVETISVNAFYGCSGLTGGLTIPDSVNSIGNYAFYGCSGLTGSLTIPDSVTSIGSNAFRACSRFTNITLANFPHTPSWEGVNIFKGFCSYGTVSTSGDGITANAVLTYLISKSLPNNWTAA